MNGKETLKKIGILGLLVLFFAACDAAETATPPVVTSPPKVHVIAAATPTPTLTLEQGEVAPTPTSAPEATETPVPEASMVPTPTEALTAAATPTPVATATPSPTATPKPTATPTPTKVPETTSYQKGTLTETGYESKWLGLRFTWEDGMEITPSEELDGTMRLLYEALSGKTAPENLVYEQLPVVYEMELTWQDKGLIMQLLVEPLEDESVIEDDYVSQMVEEVYSLEEMGLSYEMDDMPRQEVIGGKTFMGFGYTTYFGEDISLRQQNYMRKQGDRMVLISITGESENGMQELIGYFDAY